MIGCSAFCPDPGMGLSARRKLIGQSTRVLQLLGWLLSPADSRPGPYDNPLQT